MSVDDELEILSQQFERVSLALCKEFPEIHKELSEIFEKNSKVVVQFFTQPLSGYDKKTVVDVARECGEDVVLNLIEGSVMAFESGSYS